MEMMVTNTLHMESQDEWNEQVQHQTKAHFGNIVFIPTAWCLRSIAKLVQMSLVTRTCGSWATKMVEHG